MASTPVPVEPSQTAAPVGTAEKMETSKKAEKFTKKGASVPHAASVNPIAKKLTKILDSKLETDQVCLFVFFSNFIPKLPKV